MFEVSYDNLRQLASMKSEVESEKIIYYTEDEYKFVLFTQHDGLMFKAEVYKTDIANSDLFKIIERFKTDNPLTVIKVLKYEKCF